MLVCPRVSIQSIYCKSSHQPALRWLQVQTLVSCHVHNERAISMYHLPQVVVVDSFCKWVDIWKIIYETLTLVSSRRSPRNRPYETGAASGWLSRSLLATYLILSLYKKGENGEQSRAQSKMC